MAEEYLNGVPEEGLEDNSSPPVSSSAGSTVRKPVSCLLMAVMGIALVCAFGVIAALVIGRPRTLPTPTPQPPPTVTVLEIRNVAKLESIEYYSVAEISQVQVPDNWVEKLGLKEEIFILEYGTVVGGFDLTQLPDDAIWQDGWRVMLKLPAPEILRVEIDSDKSRVVYRKGWCPEMICGDDVDDFIRKIEPQAVEQLKKQAVEYGLLDRAARSGRDYFYYFLKSLGFTEVRVVVDGYIYE